MTESSLSKKWMDRLQQQCAEHKEHILILNCQGKSRLPRGVSDYLVLYKGRWLSIECKRKTKIRSNQEDFLNQTTFAGGVGLSIKFLPFGKVVNVASFQHLDQPVIYAFDRARQVILDAYTL